MLWVDNQSVTSSAAQSIQFFMIEKLRLSFDIVLKVIKVNNKIPRLHLLWACEAVLTLDLKVLKKTNKQQTDRLKRFLIFDLYLLVMVCGLGKCEATSGNVFISSHFESFLFLEIASKIDLISGKQTALGKLIDR